MNARASSAARASRVPLVVSFVLAEALVLVALLGPIWDREWWRGFRGNFSGDQLSYAAIAANVAEGDPWFVEPFTETGTLFYPSFWYQAMGLISLVTGAPIYLLWTVMGVLAVSTAVLVVGFPLGFHDTLHHMPVVRHAVVASSFGLRFNDQGSFLTDARTHSGTSGAPVVMRIAAPQPMRGDLRWMLLGVHSARLDVGTRVLKLDEALGLNCAWYADILLTLTDA